MRRTITEFVTGGLMRYVVLMTLIVLSCGNPAVVHAGAEQRDSLRGLPGVAVDVVVQKSAVEEDGLLREEVQTAVELILRSSGIRILSLTERARLPSAPVFMSMYPH